MSKVVKGPGSRTPSANPAGGIEEILGGLLGGGGLGSILGGGGSTAGTSPVGGNAAGGLGALIPSLLPAILGMLGGQGGSSTSGVHQLVDSMNQNGLGDVAASWVGKGENQPISASQVSQVLSPGQLSELASKTGLSPDQVTAGVAQVLPGVVNHLTPDGSLPEAGQIAGVAGQLGGALGKLLGH